MFDFDRGKGVLFRPGGVRSRERVVPREENRTRRTSASAGTTIEGGCIRMDIQERTAFRPNDLFICF